MNRQINIALIYDSTRTGRLCDTVVGWAAARIACRNEFDLHRDSVAFSNVWGQFDDGILQAPERANERMATLLARLRWWATALHNARQSAPYAEAVA